MLDNFRRYAEEKNTTITSLVEAYLRRVLHQEIPENAPTVRRLSGMLSQEISIDDHKKYLAEK